MRMASISRSLSNLEPFFDDALGLCYRFFGTFRDRPVEIFTAPPIPSDPPTPSAISETGNVTLVYAIGEMPKGYIIAWR